VRGYRGRNQNSEPPHSLRSLDLSSAGRGENRTAFSRCVSASELCEATKEGPLQKAKGAERRKAQCLWSRASGRGSGPAGPLASRRSTAVLVAATERHGSIQAALHASERTQALPAPSLALKRSTSRAGRYAGGVDARIARERSDEPRPRGPHALRFRIVSRNALA
jgi:hypothetical protein